MVDVEMWNWIIGVSVTLTILSCLYLDWDLSR